MTTLVITDSWDTTSDLVVSRLSSVFRLNSDQIRDYTISINSMEFAISNPVGLTVKSNSITSVYWRKPFTLDAYEDPHHPDTYFYAECRYVIREIYNLCRRLGASALVEEGAERRLGKLCQLNIASLYFIVPDWRVNLGLDVKGSDDEIVKSMSGEPVNRASVLYSTHIAGLDLDEKFLWFIQKKITKDADVTVVFVDGVVFAFKYDRNLDVIDWRENIVGMVPSDWTEFVCEEHFIISVKAFMDACRLRFGRLDFVMADNVLYFLEVNPNGQWAWLDIYDKTGLLSSIIRSIE